jgi:sigma-B regulation protein RsbU (phosphoserine phosphatase)
MIAPSIPHNEKERLASLRSLGLVDTPPEERFDAITRLASTFFHTPISYISLVDETRQYLKSRIGLDFCESDRETSFCGHAILENEPLVISDTLQDERFATNPQVTGEPFARFYAGLPLRGPGGHNIATLCLMDTKPRDFSDEEISQLKHLGVIAERELHLGDVIRMQEDLLKTKDALIESQKQVAQQMDEALAYVTSLLPDNLQAPMKTNWQFLPSSTLGGDSFGYHWIDDDHFAIYLLDVCGHGVGSALLSVSAMNVLRTQTLPAADFLDPASVLDALNKTFPMEENNGLYFTIWYGVLQVSSGRLRYSAAGHPPAVLVRPDQEIETLGAPGLPVGCYESAKFDVRETTFANGSHLYVFSDGIYEVRLPDDSMGTYDDFIQNLKDAPTVSDIIDKVRQTQAGPLFDDDVSVLRIER